MATVWAQTLPPNDRIELAKSKARRLADEGKVDEAIELLSEELAMAPEQSDLLLLIANILVASGQLPEAVDTLTVLKAHIPDNAEILKLLGAVLAKMRYHERSIEELQRAHRLTPDDPEILTALAQNYERLNNVGEATDLLLKAVELSPENIELRCYAAGILNYAGKTDECRQILLSNPEVAEMPEIRLLEAMLMPIVASSKEEILELREHYRDTLLSLAATGLTSTHPEKKLVATNYMLGYQGMDDRELTELSARTIVKLYPELAYVSPNLERSPLSGRRIKVGFVSPNMRKHSVGRVLNGFLKELNRQRFEVILFELPGKFDGGQEEVRQLPDKVVFVPKGIGDARSVIEREEIDILVFPDFVLEPRIDQLAHSRLAPVQCTTWGHPGTSGRPSIDYWVSCTDWDPEGNERFYSEKLVRLSAPPMIASMETPPSELTSRADLGIPEGRIYGCSQPLYKIHPDFDDILAEILKRDPEGHLILIRAAQEDWVVRYLDRFRGKYGDLVNRITILPYLKFHDYLSLLSHFSVFLDPTDFGGGISSLEALTMGIPIITWPGQQLRNRMAYSFYKMMGFTDLVVDSKEAYIQLALKIAHNDEYREGLSKTIIEKRHAVFETVEITRELEAFFEEAIANALPG